MEQRHTYGGQAVLEGVMIRGRNHVSVAVRRPDGGIALRCTPIGPLFTGRLRRLPVIRGVIVLAETLTLGMRALNYSANVGMGAEDEELGGGAIAGVMIMSAVLAIGIFFLVPVFASKWFEDVLGSDLASNFLEGVLRLVMFLGYLALIGRLRDIQRVFMYHGAEHMTVHAQERGEPLDVDSIRRYPAAHPRCGTAFLLTVMVVAILAFVFVGREPFWWLISSRVVLIPVIAGLSYEAIRFSGRHSGNLLVRTITAPNLMLQKLTTRQPDDGQIEIAIAAMQGAVQADGDEAREGDEEGRPDDCIEELTDETSSG